jgi:hypothetical protein
LRKKDFTTLLAACLALIGVMVAARREAAASIGDVEGFYAYLA